MARAVHIVREPGPHLVEIDAELGWIGVRARLTFVGGLRPPTLHSGFELSADGCPQPGVQAVDLTDRIGLHGVEVDVVEPLLGTVGAEPQRALHSRASNARR